MRPPKNRSDSKPLNDILNNTKKDPSLELYRKISWVKNTMDNMKTDKLQHIRKSANHVTDKLTNKVVTKNVDGYKLALQSIILKKIYKKKI